MNHSPPNALDAGALELQRGAGGGKGEVFDAEFRVFFERWER